MREVRALALQHKFDYLVIESTGVSVPMPVAATFATGLDGEDHHHDHDHDEEHEDGVVEFEQTGSSSSSKEEGGHGGSSSASQALAQGGLADVARLDTLVTVVDAER